MIRSDILVLSAAFLQHAVTLRRDMRTRAHLGVVTLVALLSFAARTFLRPYLKPYSGLVRAVGHHHRIELWGGHLLCDSLPA